MLIGRGSLWFDVGPGSNQQMRGTNGLLLRQRSRIFWCLVQCTSRKLDTFAWLFYRWFLNVFPWKVTRSHLIILTWPFQTAPSTSSLSPQFYKRTGSPASLADGSGRNRTTTGYKTWVMNRWHRDMGTAATEAYYSCVFKWTVSKLLTGTVSTTVFCKYEFRAKRCPTCFSVASHQKLEASWALLQSWLKKNNTTAKTQANMRRWVQ